MDFTIQVGGIHGASKEEQELPAGQSWQTGDRARRSTASGPKVGAAQGDGGKVSGEEVIRRLVPDTYKLSPCIV
jgi:hypothetical protein